MPCFPSSYKQAFLQWIFLFFFLNWCRVDLQFYISFSLTAKGSSHIYVLYAFFFRFFSIIGYYRESRSPQSCPTTCDPMDYTARGILQARILEWVAFPFSRWSSQPRDQTQVSHIAGRFFTNWVAWEAQVIIRYWEYFLGLFYRSYFYLLCIQSCVHVHPKLLI